MIPKKLNEDTQEGRGWTKLNQQEVDTVWRNLSRELEETVVDNWEDTEAGSLTMSLVCPHCGLVPIEDII